MNLEELGELLNQATANKSNATVNIPDKNSNGVFSGIKKRLQWILGIFVVTTIIFVPYFLRHEKWDLTFLFLYLILSIESIISLIAWTQIRAMEHQSGNIMQNLLHRIQHLKWVFRSYVMLNSFFYVLLAILLEYSIHTHQDPNFEEFAKLSLPIRYGIYLFFIIFQQVIKKRSFEKNYGSYLNHMVNILKQANDE
jgi:hypothetical protein